MTTCKCTILLSKFYLISVHISHLNQLLMFKFVHLFGHLFLRAAGDVEGKVAGLGDLVEHKSLLAVHDVAVAPVALSSL